MQHGSSRVYAILLLLQTLGIAIILWEGIPIYRRIVAGAAGQHVDSGALALAALAVGLVQGAYWLRLALVPGLKLPRNIFLSHLAVFVGRISFIFGTALFSTVLYYRLPELQLSFLRLVILVAVLFSMFCYALELERLGTALSGELRE